MPNLASIRCGFYRIPLPVVLSDSTHGEMRAFELITVRLTDAEGAEGVGYTYTAGRNGAAVRAILEREIAELFGGEEADEIERIWRKAWWALHYGGRGGPTVLAISAFDMALWDLKAKRARLPLWNLLGGFDARVPCYAGGIDLDLALDKLLRQTDDNLARDSAPSR
jgi:L-alanine-DL-glutamate epimerase-like enolase superfamily enzyme